MKRITKSEKFRKTTKERIQRASVTKLNKTHSRVQEKLDRENSTSLGTIFQNFTSFRNCEKRVISNQNIQTERSGQEIAHRVVVKMSSCQVVTDRKKIFEIYILF